MKTGFVIITCEHGGNRIPSRYRRLFDGYETLLPTHRGYDAGALRLARELAAALNAPLHASTVSRLLIDLNRSLNHPQLYSEATRAASKTTREEIRQRYYLPYRNEIETRIEQAIARGHPVVHISCHSFTPRLDGELRHADIGLLYDPSRTGELDLCRRWRAELNLRALALKVRMNYPYAGKNDGFTKALRRRFAAGWYIGIELEINQQRVFDGGRRWREVRKAVIETLRQVLAISDDHRIALPHSHAG